METTQKSPSGYLYNEFLRTMAANTMYLKALPLPKV